LEYFSCGHWIPKRGRRPAVPVPPSVSVQSSAGLAAGSMRKRIAGLESIALHRKSRSRIREAEEACRASLNRQTRHSSTLRLQLRHRAHHPVWGGVQMTFEPDMVIAIARLRRCGSKSSRSANGPRVWRFQWWHDRRDQHGLNAAKIAQLPKMVAKVAAYMRREIVK